MANIAGLLVGTHPASNGLIGGGGWVTGGDIADDGTIIARCDTTGPVIRGPADPEWTRLMRAGETVDPALLESLYDDTTYDVALCATNSLIAYCAVMGRVWKTIDGGATLTRTALPYQANCSAAEAARMTGKMLAVDPENGDVVFFGAPTGLKYSIDGGANWTSVSTGIIPAPTADKRMIVAFDRSSAVTGGKTQGIYVFSNGHGLYHSGDGGATWAEVEDAAANASHMRVGASNGYVHLAGDGAGVGNAQYRRWDGADWIAPTDISSKSIAISTINAGRMWLCGEGGGLRVSTDHGATWSGEGAPLRVATNMPWHAWTAEFYMSNGDILFDPDSGALWMLEGIGAWKNVTPPAAIGGAVAWTEASLGIENMVTTLVDVAPDGRLLYACHDRIAFTIPKAQVGRVFPAKHAIYGSTAIVHGGNVDYALDDPNFLVANAWDFDGKYSEDGGATWPDMPGSIKTASGGIGGGNIIALSTTCFIQLETNNGKLMRSTDGGDTWTRRTIGNNNDTYGHLAYWLHRRVLVKDEYVAGQAYLYHIGNDPSGDPADVIACRGIWKTSDYGATWTRIKTDYIIGWTADFWNGKLRQLGPDDWLWCGGDGAIGLWRSTDGMVSWARDSGQSDDINGASEFGDVMAVAVGAGISAGAPKAVIVWGHRHAAPAGHPTDYSGYGLWESIDGMATWKRLAQFPGGYFCNPADIAADPTQYGRYLLGTSGGGLPMLTYSDARVDV